MNILAHSYLSGDSEEIRVGNFMGDFVKGNDYEKYPENIKKGIIVHRNIDYFTDTHKVVNRTKEHFYPVFHKYAGIIVDVLYDHYLSIHWDKFSNEKLTVHIEKLYRTLDMYKGAMPLKVQRFATRFIERDWVSYYNTIEGIEFVFQNLAERTSLPDLSTEATKIINECYENINLEFLRYFPSLIAYVEEKFDIQMDYSPPE